MFDNDALAAAAESATVKALTGDAGTDMYAEAGLTGWAKLPDVGEAWAEAWLTPEGGPRREI